MIQMKMTMHRRAALKSSALGLGIAAWAPRGVFAESPQAHRLRIAAVGFGGRGRSDLLSMQDHPSFQLTAACDVDASFFPIADSFGDGCAKFQDYRRLFAEAGPSFDAVVIATPDHMHAPIAELALKQGKHVYLQKPLTQDVAECRRLARLSAAHPQLATQMGIQIHAHPAYRSAVRWIREGVIGIVREVHSWSGKGWGGEMPSKDATPPPPSLAWDLYCGVSEVRPYVEGWYHRNNWRKWFAFGTGTQGDMGCHILDPVFSALGLTAPTQVTSHGPRPFAETHALVAHVAYEFPGTEWTNQTLPLTWYNGSSAQKLSRESLLPCPCLIRDRSLLVNKAA